MSEEKKATVFKVKEFEEQVCKMRKRGMSKQSIAEHFRVSQYRVRQILERNHVNIRIDKGRRTKI